MNWTARTHLTKMTQACSDVTTDIAKNDLIIHLELCTHKKKRVEKYTQCKGEKRRWGKKKIIFIVFSALKQKVLFPAWIPITPSQQRKDRERENEKLDTVRDKEKNLVVHWKQIVLNESCISPKYMRGEKRIGRKIRKKIGKTDRMKQWSIIAK